MQYGSLDPAHCQRSRLRCSYSRRVDSTPENAGGVVFDLVEDCTDRLTGLEVEVRRPFAIAVADVERPGSAALVADLGDGHSGPFARCAPPDWSAFMNGDGLASSGDLEANFELELGGNTFVAPPPDLLDIELGEDDGHPKKANGPSRSKGSRIDSWSVPCPNSVPTIGSR